MGILNKLARICSTSSHSNTSGNGPTKRTKETDDANSVEIAQREAAQAAYKELINDREKTLEKCFCSSKQDTHPQKEIKAALKKIPAQFTIQYLIEQNIDKLEDIIKAYKIVDLKKEYKLIKASSKPNNDVTFENFQSFVKKERCLPTTKRAKAVREALRQQGMPI